MPFRTSGSAVVAADGTAEVSIYPPGGVDWLLTLATVSTSTSVLQPVARAYVNSRFVEGSDSGSQDASDTRRLLRANDEYKVQWTGADVGARATLTLEGNQYRAGTAPVV
jgi:hypothetical protein